MLCRSTPPSTRDDVQRWIAETFARYHKMASILSSVRCGWSFERVSEPSSAEDQFLDRFKDEFASAFEQYEVPIEIFGKIDDNEMQLWASRGIYTYTVSSQAARVFLQSRIRSEVDSTAERPFPFMRLPAELRVRIYEYALHFPKQGLMPVSTIRLTNKNKTPQGGSHEPIPTRAERRLV